MTTTIGAVDRGTLGRVSVRVAPGPHDSVESAVLARARREPETFDIAFVDRIVLANEQACSVSSRTDCGEVSVQYGTAGGTDGLFKVDDLCTTGGDSGGPYFAGGAAYGIHSAGYGSGCHGGWAGQAPEAEDQMNVNILSA